MLSRAQVLSMGPDVYERMWRAMLHRKFGCDYRRIDAKGVDALIGHVGYQIYHHQGGAWKVVQQKFRDDLNAARATYPLHRWVFITSFDFKEPDHVEWLDQQIQLARPVEVQCWQQEQLDQWSSQFPEILAHFCPTGTLSVQNVYGSTAVVIGPNGIRISGTNAVILGPNAIRIG